MIKANSKDIEDLKAALAVTNKAIEDNAKEIEGLKSDLDEVKAEVKEAYERAIRDAIASLRNELSADITAAINDADSKVQGEIDRMSSEIRKMEKSVSDKITQSSECCQQGAVQNTVFGLCPLYRGWSSCSDKIWLGFHCEIRDVGIRGTAFLRAVLSEKG